MHAPRRKIFEKNPYLTFFIEVSGWQYLIENFLSFILFKYIEKHSYERLLITNIMSTFFSSTGICAIILSERFPIGAITFIRSIPNPKRFYTFHLYLLCQYDEFQQNIVHMFHLIIFPDKVFIKDWQHCFNNSLLQYLPGLLTKGFCLFCSAIPRGYDIFKTKPNIS